MENITEGGKEELEEEGDGGDGGGGGGDSEEAEGDLSGMEMNREEGEELEREAVGGRGKREDNSDGQKAKTPAESSERYRDRSAVMKDKGGGERSRSPLSRRESSTESLPCGWRDAAAEKGDTKMVRGQRGRNRGGTWRREGQREKRREKKWKKEMRITQ